MIAQMAIAIALLEFNDLGHSVTPTFLFRNWFCLQLPPHCSKMNKKSMWEGEKNSRFLSVRHRILPSCGCKVHTRAKFLPRSRRDWGDLAEISPWCLLDSKSQRDRGEISSISPRLPRTRRDCRDRAEIVEISPWRLWHSKSRRDRGEISSISPRLLRSRRDL